MRTCWIVVAQVLVLSSLSAPVQSAFDARVAKNLKVRWSSVRYDKSVVVENPEISKTPEQESENLTLSCRVEVQDPNAVLGIGRQAIITQLTDSRGRDIPVVAPATDPHETYEGLRYAQQFRQPAPLPKWRAFIQRILQRPPQRMGPPQLAMELQPTQITARLDMGLLDRAGGEIRSVKGHFHALLAGSTEHVEVPFEPNNAWVRLTPDLEIQMQEAVSGNTFFRYRIDVRPQGGGPRRPLIVGQPVPERFVAAQEFIGEDGKPVRHFGGFRSLPAHVGGSGSGGGSVGRVKAIRFVIAVGAKGCEIPFELQRVPLPKP